MSTLFWIVGMNHALDVIICPLVCWFVPSSLYCLVGGSKCTLSPYCCDSEGSKRLYRLPQGKCTYPDSVTLCSQLQFVYYCWQNLRLLCEFYGHLNMIIHLTLICYAYIAKHCVERIYVLIRDDQP